MRSNTSGASGRFSADVLSILVEVDGGSIERLSCSTPID